ncbi:uncharacterized protein TNCV_2443151 [Trichonephila clavipes]|nr:uncharacterized protein TNCV_2443151 [Trichonephila clavipes]
MKGSVESYLKKLKEKLEVATHKAKLTSDVQQGSYAKYYNRKRVGSRLRKLKKNTKGLGGKRKLTDKFIDKLQNYYGITAEPSAAMLDVSKKCNRSNVGCLKKMQSAVITAFFHCCSSNQNPMHGQCQTVKDSWCKYK